MGMEEMGHRGKNYKDQSASHGVRKAIVLATQFQGYGYKKKKTVCKAKQISYYELQSKQRECLFEGLP